MKRRYYILTIVFFSFTSVSIKYLDVDEIKPLIPFRNITRFCISDTLPTSNNIDYRLFQELFQHFSEKHSNKISMGGYPPISEVLFDRQYLLSYNGKIKENGINLFFDIITVLSKEKDTTRIYLLPFAEKNYSKNGIKIKKGAMKIPYTIELAKKYQTDSTFFESYSTFIDSSLISVISITRYKNINRIDSMIQVVRLSFYDQSVLDDAKYYINGESIFNNE